mmetsp:Transcript_9281/g.22127  ORF Transcript_9281/g.22127 Transcript_9281/m.22127 type:complete len:203 (+) Transcript_9281:1871-2479(+)
MRLEHGAQCDAGRLLVHEVEVGVVFQSLMEAKDVGVIQLLQLLYQVAHLLRTRARWKLMFWLDEAEPLDGGFAMDGLYQAQPVGHTDIRPTQLVRVVQGETGLVEVWQAEVGFSVLIAVLGPVVGSVVAAVFVTVFLLPLVPGGEFCRKANPLAVCMLHARPQVPGLLHISEHHLFGEKVENFTNSRILSAVVALAVFAPVR